ncbi:MAG: DUF892 family protein [Armatimonadetes bacterium]|nr:DUF892 family protein [Akkermansiaceae bacterium]
MITESSTKPSSFSLRNLLQEQTRDLYDAENSYCDFLGKMMQTTTNAELAEELASIATDSRSNIADLEDICNFLEVPSEGIKCHAMAGLLREAKEITDVYECSSVKDAALIANAQRIAHYEIAGFGTAKAFAVQLKLPKVEALFSDLLVRASKADKALTKIAVGSWLTSGINNLAAAGN